MRKLAALTTAFILFLTCAIGTRAATEAFVIWEAQTTGALLFNSAGTALSGPSFLMQIVLDPIGNTSFGNLTSGLLGMGGGGDTTGWAVDASASDDIVISSSVDPWLDFSGVYGNNAGTITPMNGNGGKDFYFRWFNQASIATVDGTTQAGIIYSLADGWQTPAIPADPAPNNLPLTVYLDYGTAGVGGSKNAGNTGWATLTPVPEPGTIGMFVLGLAAIAARRRANRR